MLSMLSAPDRPPRPGPSIGAGGSAQTSKCSMEDLKERGIYGAQQTKMLGSDRRRDTKGATYSLI